MRQLLDAAGQLLRVDPHRIHRRADRQRLAVAIGDVAAMRDDRGDAREARIALLRQEAVIDQLQIHRAPDQAPAAASSSANSSHWRSAKRMRPSLARCRRAQRP